MWQLDKINSSFLADPERYGRLGQDAFAFFVNDKKTNGDLTAHSINLDRHEGIGNLDI